MGEISPPIDRIGHRLAHLLTMARHGKRGALYLFQKNPIKITELLNHLLNAVRPVVICLINPRSKL